MTSAAAVIHVSFTKVSIFLGRKQEQKTFRILSLQSKILSGLDLYTALYAIAKLWSPNKEKNYHYYMAR